MKKKILHIFDRLMNDALYHDSRDINRERQRKALRETVDFIEEHLPLARAFESRYRLIEYAITLTPTELKNSLVCEFGVSAGKSLNFIAGLVPDETIYGFDSFEGLPEDWTYRARKGEFKMKELPKVKPNVELVVGYYDETLPKFLEKVSGEVRFIHFDSDLYSSTKSIFVMMGDRIREGSVACFDDFFNYPGWREGEYKALVEFVQESGKLFRYIGYNSKGNQVGIQFI